MGNKTDNIKDHLPKWVYWVWLTAIVSLGIAITTLFIGVTPYVCWNVETVSLSIILAFVGILATFVVVSNYWQVKEIESKFYLKVQEIENKFDAQVKDIEGKFKVKVNEIKDEFEKQVKDLNKNFQENIDKYKDIESERK